MTLSEIIEKGYHVRSYDWYSKHKGFKVVDPKTGKIVCSLTNKFVLENIRSFKFYKAALIYNEYEVIKEE